MPISCASEVVKNMGGNDEEVIMASGFAGGLGLSGNACGALSAAIWMNSLRWLKNHDAKSSYTNPLATNTLKTFNEQTECEISCKKITGSCFNSIKDHAEFIKYGGCKRLMTVLAESSV
ncbi:MAG TPA: hypothetical protein DCX54_12245 [Flavobacteriales bacterium]|nr:hypothetical protein [Flavobacteriales bacterium]